MSAPPPLPTAADLRRVAASVDELALRAALDDDPTTLRQMLSDAADRATWSKATTTNGPALFGALAICYLRIAGSDWHRLAGQAAWDVARRAVALADEL